MAQQSQQHQTIRDVMTPNPVVLDATSSLTEAARNMRDQDIGDVIVQNDGSVCGIVTDRDIVIRGLAQGGDPNSTTLGDVCSTDLHMVGSDADVMQAVELMRDQAIRRLPVVDDGQAVGVVSIGDLAIERDRESALADISAAPPNE